MRTTPNARAINSSWIWEKTTTPRRTTISIVTGGEFISFRPPPKTRLRSSIPTKGRWFIETYNNYVKNDADFNDLKIQDYYVQHGFDFIMLVTGIIHEKLNEAVKRINKSSVSIFDVLLKAGHMRMVKRKENWQLHNTRTKDLVLLEAMGFVPEESYPL